MFGRPKTQTDVKKSTQKLLDTKKDVSTRLKHLKIILENADGAEAKAIFSTHYSHIYHLVYEGIIAAEASLKQKGVHRAQREELESVVHLLEKIIVLLPDLLHCRWQLHSLSRLMAKLNHPSNSIKLRREGMRLFLMWYQCLGSSAPNYIHSIYASLVPGLPGLPAETWPPPTDPSWGISPLEITAVIPASSSEKQPEDLTAYFLECLLDYMVSQAPKIHWKDGLQMWATSIDFLYERFKEFYLPRIFPNFEVCTDIYKPKLDLPQLRRGSNDSPNQTLQNCQVVFVKWVANYSHSVYRSSDCYHQPVWTAPSTVKTIVQNDEPDRAHSTPPSSLSGGDRDSIASYSSIPSDVDANVLGKDVILGSRTNINLVHEVFRRALLMNFVQSAAIRRVIGVYKDWIQINVPELPVFMLEPEGESEENGRSSKLDSPKSRLRTDSYMGAIGYNANNNREEYLSHLRAGGQKVLRIFFCNSASVFLLMQQKNELASVSLLEEQVDICKRVLNIYRYTVMNTRMDPKTWEQLLIVMVHITSTILDPNQSPRNVNKDALGPKLAAALFQTLVVSWVKASLNVPISVELWDQLQSVLSQLSYIDDLITEWAKTMETLTRVLARHLYNLDLANLPLDKLSEQKAMKRALQSGTFVKTASKQAPSGTEGVAPFTRKRNASSGTTDRNSLPFAPSTPIPQRTKLGLRRSLSEGNILSPEKGSRSSSDSPDASVSKRIERANGDLEAVRKRKISRSFDFDTVRRLVNKDAASVSQYSNMQSEWAEISSSTASLENTHSSIHMDGDGASVNVSVSLEKEEPLGVILGGSIKGWLPSVAGVLWRRMLGVLGNPNQFTNPKTHFHFFQVLTEIWNTLFKLKLNQCISIDNSSTPKPSELVPPLTIIAPWCLDALELPDEYHKGKVLACSLLCEITLMNQDIILSHEYLCKFYAAMHKQILISKQDVVNEIVRKCGVKFTSKMLPGFSLLALDLIQAAHSVLNCEELKSTPRTEAATLLGSILAVADIFKEIPVLKPNSMQFHPIQSQQAKEIVISCLIMNAKKERTSHGRAIVLQSLTNYLAQQLMDIRVTGPTNLASCGTEFKKRLNDILSVLLECVKVENRSVALVASDLLSFLSEFATEISSYMTDQCGRIILGLKRGLEQMLPLKNSTKSSGKPPDIEKRLCISLMLSLSEWCMNLPLPVLLSTSDEQKTSLLTAVFEIFLMIARGYRDPQSASTTWKAVDDFDPHIPFDDLRVSDTPKWLGKENTTINPEKAASQEADTIKLAARTMMLHFMTQLGHFPVSNEAERCSSIVCENDDLSGISSELDEFNSRVFTLPNLQMFTLDNETLVTMVELPFGMPDDSITSAFQTSNNQVRVIVRDLSGKACWDATNLICVSNSNDQTDTSVLVQPHFNEDLFYQSAITGSFFPPVGPRLTLRKRVMGTLPTVEDSAGDLDNLDDLLNYIGYTSPECQLVVGESLTSPWGPPPSLSKEIEDDVVSAVVNQRNSEMEYLMKTDLDPLLRARPITCADWIIDDGESENMNSESSFGITSKINSISSSFLLSRRVFSQLGYTGWDKRTTVNLLNKDEKLLRELKHLDSQKCREVHKIAVIYVAEGQDDKQSILYNSGGSEAYEDFVAGLGWEVELESHTGFMGGLQRNKSTGETAPYYATSFAEVMYHVATRMPSNTDESLLQKTRHLGNDEVHIVWSENKREYRRDIIPTEFCDVLIIIYPLQYGLFRVQIVRKPEVPYFGPLFNGAIVERDILAPLVRATAINASRAKRCSLQFFQHHFQERAKCLSTIIQNHKIRSTFEQFTTNVFSPRLPPSFQPRAIHRASATSFSSVSHVSVPSAPPPHQLASALVDHSVSFNSGPIRSSNSPAPLLSSNFQDVKLSSNQEANQYQGAKNLNNHSPPQRLLVPPVPPKRLGAKLSAALKPKLHTPPSSPRVSPPRNQHSVNSNKQ